MFDRKRKASYVDQRKWRRALWTFAGSLLLLFVIMNLVFHSIAMTIQVDNETMSPLLQPGDRLIVLMSSFGFKIPLANIVIAKKPPQRGDLVLFKRLASVEPTWRIKFFDNLVRFVTFQQCSLINRRLAIKRIIGLPGDQIALDAYIARIKEADAPYMLTEFELIAREYDITQNLPPEGWHDDLPFSSFMEIRSLASDEYFLLSDNRPLQSDSRTWGAVSPDQILAKAVFRYWPPARLGAL